jgi:hypothetical protein
MTDTTYDRFAGLPVTVESVRLDGREQAVTSGFIRRTTLVRLRGAGHEGIGEDVTYAEANQLAFQRASFDLAGTTTLAALSERVGGLDLFADEPGDSAFVDYRRWAFESAALDLALRQAGRSLADALGREPSPVTFVVSLRLPEPPTAEPVRRLLSLYPRLRLKLDATSSWDDGLVEELAALGSVDSLDLKGAYSGTVVDQPPDPDLYERVVRAFPDAWIEDPALTPETEPILRPHRNRITWDAPIHSVADIDALPFPPRMLNIKPSRFGSVSALFDAYDFCAANGIAMYGGGQFELGPGRGQIQLLAALFHPDGPNDVAPSAYNEGEPRPGLPESPLDPDPTPTGFRRRDAGNG